MSRASPQGRAQLGRLRHLIALVALAAAPARPADPFTDVTAAVGVDFVHFNGMSGRFYYPEVVGAGGALFDLEGDGDLDLYLVQGAMLGADLEPGQATFPPRPGEPLRDRVYRNELESGWLRFADITEASGVRSEGYGMGVAAGDIDNDGDVDLYLTNWGDNQLWRNRGDGTFEEATATSGLGDRSWGSSASFVDYDGDGWLDLYLVNYILFSYEVHKTCLTERGETDYCLPSSFRPARDRLFHNRGDGTFEDVSERSGIARAAGNGLGVISADFDGDGRLDFYIANDLMPNFLWLQQADGTFRENGLISGSALNADGQAEASMGIDVADFDDDGDFDIFMTHLGRETNTLFTNDGEGMFRDLSLASGLGRPSWDFTAFGTGWADFDFDGDLDLVVGNGAVTFPSDADRSSEPFPLDEPNQIFVNRGGGTFEDLGEQAGEAIRRSEVTRGVILGDIDNDGDTDLVITNNNGPARVLRANADVSRPWIGLETRLSNDGRDALGSSVRLTTADGRTLLRRVATDGGYATARDPRLQVALGDKGGDRVSVEIRWPDGSSERWENLATKRYHALARGSGKK